MSAPCRPEDVEPLPPGWDSRPVPWPDGTHLACRNCGAVSDASGTLRHDTPPTDDGDDVRYQHEDDVRANEGREAPDRGPGDGEIERALEGAMRATHLLTDALNTLEDRLEAVLRPEEPSAAETTPGMSIASPPVAPLTERLVGVERRVDRSAARVHEILDRLAL